MRHRRGMTSPDIDVTPGAWLGPVARIEAAVIGSRHRSPVGGLPREPHGEDWTISHHDETPAQSAGFTLMFVIVGQ
jgi:hypothetical protein